MRDAPCQASSTAFVAAARMSPMRSSESSLVTNGGGQHGVDVFLAVGVGEHRAVAADPHTTGPRNGRIVLRMNQRREIAREKIVQSSLIVCSKISVPAL